MQNGIRLAEERDLPHLIEIWKNCFPDSDAYIRFFYRACFDLVTAAVYTVDDRPVSMLHWFDASFTDGAEQLDAKFLYAGGTHPDYRHNRYYGDLFQYIKDFAEKNDCVIFGKPARRELVPYYQTMDFTPDAYFRLVTVYPEEIVPIHISPLEAEAYNRMRDRAFSDHPYVKWSDRYVQFCMDENAFFGGKTVAVELDGSSHIMMCAPQGDTLRITETDLTLRQLRAAAASLCKRFETKRLMAYLPDYSCSEGEEIVSSIVYHAPLRNTYVNLILI